MTWSTTVSTCTIGSGAFGAVIGRASSDTAMTVSVTVSGVEVWSWQGWPDFARDVNAIVELEDAGVSGFDKPTLGARLSYCRIPSTHAGARRLPYYYYQSAGLSLNWGARDETTTEVALGTPTQWKTFLVAVCDGADVVQAAAHAAGSSHRKPGYGHAEAPYVHDKLREALA